VRRKALLDADAVVRALQGAFARDAGRPELLSLAASRIRAAGGPYTGVYLYMLQGNDLVLEAFEGRATDHARIPVGTGICGRAVAERRDLNVPDVSQADGYLACSVETRSELVVLIRRNEEILGQIDIDSDVTDGFDQREQAAVKQVADALAVLL
jgi:GAF domain-containing protein